jgi:translation initiation factor 5B
VIFGAVTIFGILSWYFVPEQKWLRRSLITQQIHTANDDSVAGSSTVPELSSRESIARRHSEDTK